MAFYRFIKVLEYEMVNIGQDHNEVEAEQASLKKKKSKLIVSDKDMV